VAAEARAFGHREAATPNDVDALASVLVAFYDSAKRVGLAEARASSRASRPSRREPDAAARASLPRVSSRPSSNSGALAARAGIGHLVDGHGDLRPEHLCLLEPPVVIDCLEFDDELPAIDPLDEIACLALECHVAGAGRIGPHTSFSAVRTRCKSTRRPGLQ
jgi:aminoglycoside phosphotransferase family enzyme